MRMSDIGSKIKCTISKFAHGTYLSGAVDRKEYHPKGPGQA